MTKEEAIKSFEEDNRTMLENKTAYINELKARGMEFEDRMVSYIDESVERNELAISALKDEWIPIVTRPMTEEEKEEYLGEYDPNEIQMYACPIPEDGQEVLITTRFDDVITDTFYRDDGCYFETYCDDGEVVAWRPKPEPYKKGE